MTRVPGLGGMELQSPKKENFIDLVILIAVVVAVVMSFLGLMFNVSILDAVQEPSDAVNSISLDSLREELDLRGVTFDNLDGNSFGEHLTLAQNQQDIVNALVLNELGASDCVVSNSFQVDVNTLGVSLLCPVQQGGSQ